MSRCFPYPPPGFTKKASDVSTLIDSIKLQKEIKANKETRKEKRRDKGHKDKRGKKEKKREKREKKDPLDSKQTKVGNEGEKDCKTWTESEVLSQKRKREETEQLEGSSVTEEHGQPLNLQNPSYSSDGTQYSNKRRKQASVASDSAGNGNIIRIKLPLHKHKESGSAVSKEQLQSTVARNVQNKDSVVIARGEQQQCSTSGRNEKHNEQICSETGLTGLVGLPAEDVAASLTSFRKTNSLQSFPCPINEFCSTSGNTDNLPQGHPQTSVSVPGSCSNPRDRKMQKKISKYDNLIQNLYEMAIPGEVVDTDGEDWLFGGKCSDTVVKKRNVVDNQLLVNRGVTCSGSSTLYPLHPRARYLEEAKIYALPYTVPF
ncbi:uncharacterized protein LOC141720846 [Apium graveolens]|uniref:uncharacterized protein LOC141720846 n=1 Tax=Apium graveolens TaxID=4045 RepID=UPI003D7957A6